MKIIYPDSEEIKKYTGPGGYESELVKILINKKVDIFGFHRIKIPKGSISAEHYHNEFVEIFVCLTKMRIKINGEEFNVPKDALIVLYPGDKHEEYADDIDVEYFAMKFPFVEGDKFLSK